MILSYPDVMGEYLTARERLATGGVQYAGYFEPGVAAPGQMVNLFVFLQNVLSIPLTIQFELILPREGGFFGGGEAALEVEELEFELKLLPAEAGLLTIPVMVTAEAKQKKYTLILVPKTKMEGRGERVRAEKSQSTLEGRFIDSLVGLNLVGALGANFVEKVVKQGEFVLEVSGEEEQSEQQPLKYSYQTLSTQKEINIFNHAIHELNLRRVKFNTELTAEALFVTLLGASTVKLAEAGLPLRLGEAITLAKILTYTCQYFLDSPARYNGLLLPIWERALEGSYDTTDALDVVCTVGYYHLLKLSVALSFGIIAEFAGRQMWSLEERQGVIEFIADNIETGQPLELDFLYLPLLIAGTHISRQLVMEGEDIAHSLSLMKAAYETRSKLFADSEMSQIKNVYNAILQKAMT
jgi:hypothetical protein